jgi:hypothetical protein
LMLLPVKQQMRAEAGDFKPACHLRGVHPHLCGRCLSGSSPWRSSEKEDVSESQRAKSAGKAQLSVAIISVGLLVIATKRGNICGISNRLDIIGQPRSVRRSDTKTAGGKGGRYAVSWMAATHVRTMWIH